MFFAREVLVFSAMALLLAGCDVPTEEPKAVSKPSSSVAPESERETALRGLSAEDRALVDAQKLCPVSGEELGSMGMPVKMIVQEEPIFLCCAGCKKEVEADPNKYLLKVRELKKVKTKRTSHDWLLS